MPSTERENSNMWRAGISRFLLVCCVFLVANAYLQWLVDDDLGVGWTHNVIRNWEEFGFFKSHGKLLVNPGGYRVMEEPEIYSGHQPTSLWPVYALNRLFSATGLHALPFHIATAAGVIVAVWFLLGSDDRALFTAGLVVLCPGYLIWPTILDPNTNAVLGGLIIAAPLWRLLIKDVWAPADFLLVFVLCGLLSALNWTSVFVHAQIFVALVALGKVRWQRVALYSALAGLASIAVLGIAMASKFGAQPTAHHESLLEAIGGYTWGHSGYWMGQSSMTLIIRLAFINALALLPLGILWIWRLFYRSKMTALQELRTAAPFVTSAAEVLVMRNYFCQHPWMAAPVLLLGVILSLTLISHLQSRSLTAEPGSRRPGALPYAVGSVASFCFGLVVVLLYHQNTDQTLSLARMVRAHTSRADIIALSVDDTMKANDLTNRLAQAVDRHLIGVGSSPSRAECAPAHYLLSASAAGQPGWTLQGSTSQSDAKQTAFVTEAFQWFRTHIAHRKKGEALRLDNPFYLYKLNPDEPRMNSKSSGGAKDKASS